MTRATMWTTDKGDLPINLAVLNNLAATRVPAATDDTSAGYEIDSVWVYGTAIYFCTTATAAAAVWTLQGAIGGLTASAAELNKLHNATPVTAEINTLTGEPASVTMASTPASGSCAVQLTFKDSAGVAITHKVAGLLYFSNSTGVSIAHVTSNATLTHGAISELVAGYVDLFITDAAGLLGFTVTAAASSYYASLILPNGTVLTTGAIVVSA